MSCRGPLTNCCKVHAAAAPKLTRHEPRIILLHVVGDVIVVIQQQRIALVEPPPAEHGQYLMRRQQVLVFQGHVYELWYAGASAEGLEVQQGI